MTVKLIFRMPLHNELYLKTKIFKKMLLYFAVWDVERKENLNNRQCNYSAIKGFIVSFYIFLSIVSSIQSKSQVTSS